MSVERVNFIEKGKFALTYRKMAELCGIWVLFCFFIFLLLAGHSWWAGKSLESYRHKLSELNVKKDKTMALLEVSTAKPASANIKGLADIYAGFPTWSEIMLYLSKSMPAQAWLKSVSTTYAENGANFRKIEIRGESQNTSSVAKFVKELNGVPLFHNIILNKSFRNVKDGKQRYSFVIIGEVAFGEKIWK
jgi:hypothetical protein